MKAESELKAVRSMTFTTALPDEKTALAVARWSNWV